ncbi:MAG: Bug family tripartite tricarboxylate transporter substrate binding protein [Xanthobacteraceae bacterium]
MRIFRIHIVAIAAVTLLPLNAASAQPNFYDGKTVTLIVANAAGGGYDAGARALARHMKKYIPGAANVIVKNMPGAGGLVAANHMYNVAEADGLTLALLSRSSPLQPTLGISRAKFKAENFTWLGTSSSYADSAYFLVTMASSPYHSVADLRKPGKPAQIGGLAAGGTDTDVVLVARDVLKLNLQLVRGYKGSGEIGIAMERGEIHGRAIGWAPLQIGAYGRFIKEGKLRFLIQFGREKRWARMPDVPTARELVTSPQDLALIELVELPFKVTYPYVAPPNVPKDRTKILQTAFMKTFSDPGYLEEGKKLSLDVSPLDGATVRGMIARLAQMPPDLIARYKAILQGK